MNYKLFVTLLISWMVLSCNKIETGRTLSASDKRYIQSLGLLDTDESIIMFNSQMNNEVSGNFFTDKRLASYWMDERDSTKNEKEFAFYNNVIAIDTVYRHTSLTYASYMEVTRTDSTKFKVYVDGKESEVRSFFEDALKKWKSEHFKRTNIR